MPGLFLHGRRLSSVFELLGTHENDVTYSLGWGLAQSPALLSALLAKTVPGAAVTDKVNIALQEHSEDGGYTDIEIHGPDLFVIVEAKRGWQLPGGKQLQKYAERLGKSTAAHKALVALAECSHPYAEQPLTPMIAGHPVQYLSWKDVARLTSLPTAKLAERHLLRELRVYLHGIVSMQNQTSNMVYVVSLGSGIPSDLQLSWTDIVEKRQRYFHPFGKGWPKEPPNYRGFRYGGRLQSIHHVDSWKIVENLHAELPEVMSEGWPPFFLYTLGPPIVPSKPVQGGSVKWNTRVWALLDLLLTGQTISEARDLTKKRLAEDQCWRAVCGRAGTMALLTAQGAWNKTHETGYFLQHTRFLLVLERGDELWLAPLITDQWLKNGLTVDVRNAPTRMGPVSYRIVSSIGAGFIAAHIDPPTRSLPKQVVLRLRHPDGKPIRRVAVNGRDAATFDSHSGWYIKWGQVTPAAPGDERAKRLSGLGKPYFVSHSTTAFSSVRSRVTRTSTPLIRRRPPSTGIVGRPGLSGLSTPGGTMHGGARVVPKPYRPYN